MLSIFKTGLVEKVVIKINQGSYLAFLTNQNAIRSQDIKLAKFKPIWRGCPNLRQSWQHFRGLSVEQ
jgi:hypothetical protein